MWSSAYIFFFCSRSLTLTHTHTDMTPFPNWIGQKYLCCGLHRNLTPCSPLCIQCHIIFFCRPGIYLKGFTYTRHQTNVIQFKFITLWWVWGAVVRSVFIIFHLISFMADFACCRLNGIIINEEKLNLRSASQLLADRYRFVMATQPIPTVFLSAVWCG